jgi:formyl-CoA transferase
MGNPGLPADPRFSTHEVRGENQDEIEDIVAKWAVRLSLVDVETCLLAHGVVVGPVYTVDQMVNDPHFKERDSFVAHVDPRLGEGVLGPGVVPKFSRTLPRGDREPHRPRRSGALGRRRFRRPCRWCRVLRCVP